MAKARTLDRSRYLIEVWGDDEGRCFQQDGVYFDGQGNEWKPGGAQPEQVMTPKSAPTAAPAPAASSQLDKQLAS